MVRIIRFMFDWGHPWPLWEHGPDKFTMEPADYDLSPELTGRLRHCYESWSQNQDLDGNWNSQEIREQWRRESDQALAILVREVQHFADVKDERY